MTDLLAHIAMLVVIAAIIAMVLWDLCCADSRLDAENPAARCERDDGVTGGTQES